jgi:hypothetical protein
MSIEIDPEWLAILQATHGFTPLAYQPKVLPALPSKNRVTTLTAFFKQKGYVPAPFCHTTMVKSSRGVLIHQQTAHLL